MGCWMVFGPIVGVIEYTRSPIELELLLCFSVPEPVEAHIHGLCAFGLDFAIDDSFCSGVVCLDGGGWLGVSKFLKNGADVDCFLCIDV